MLHAAFRMRHRTLRQAQQTRRHVSARTSTALTLSVWSLQEFKVMETEWDDRLFIFCGTSVLFRSARVSFCAGCFSSAALPHPSLRNTPLCSRVCRLLTITHVPASVVARNLWCREMTVVRGVRLRCQAGCATWATQSIRWWSFSGAWPGGLPLFFLRLHHVFAMRCSEHSKYRDTCLLLCARRLLPPRCPALTSRVLGSPSRV